MIKNFCDNCEKEIKNNHITIKINFFETLAMKEYFELELCKECYDILTIKIKNAIYEKW